MADTSPLYPAIEPYETGMMETGDGHTIYWERSGNPKGRPAVFLHGGPGSGSNPWHRRLFNPDIYDIILFDQRGTGKSTPHASLENNTTPHLVADMEQLRETLKIESWIVAGGSWGSTLALAYADAHAERCEALVMYGIFLCRPKELRDLYHPGGVASHVFPDAFDPYLAILPEAKRADPIAAYNEIFRSADRVARLKALDLWTRLEKRASCLVLNDEELDADMADPDYVLSHSLIENHYFMSGGYIDGDAILSRIGATVRDIPVHIVQGRYDMVCPFVTAWELHKAVPHSVLHVIPDAGHSASRQPQVQKELVTILDALASCHPERSEGSRTGTACGTA